MGKTENIELSVPWNVAAEVLIVKEADCVHVMLRRESLWHSINKPWLAVGLFVTFLTIKTDTTVLGRLLSGQPVSLSGNGSSTPLLENGTPNSMLKYMILWNCAVFE